MPICKYMYITSTCSVATVSNQTSYDEVEKEGGYVLVGAPVRSSLGVCLAIKAKSGFCT